MKWFLIVLLIWGFTLIKVIRRQRVKKWDVISDNEVVARIHKDDLPSLWQRFGYWWEDGIRYKPSPSYKDD